jgi:hypothetical protein
MKEPTQGRRIRIIEDGVLIILFIAAICLPVLGMTFHLGAKPETTENRQLATFPPISLDANVLATFPGRFKDYFNDHFGFRNTLIRWQAIMKVKWLGVSSSPLVILGKDGWLFYADEYSVDGHRAVPLFTEKQLARWQERLEARRDWLARQGIHYLFAIAPSKQTIYPEYLPDTLTQIAQESRLKQLIAYLKEHSNLEFLDLRPALNEAKSGHILFHRTDSHWNFYGGFAAYQSIIRELAKWFPGLQPVSESDLDMTTRKFSGDLARMLGLSGFMIEEMPIISLSKPSYVITSVKDVQDNKLAERPIQALEGLRLPPAPYMGTVITAERKGQKLPRLVIFHDSANVFISPFLAEHFSRTVFDYAPVLDLKLIESEHPDIVIQEMGEMFLMIPPSADWPEIMSIAQSNRRKVPRNLKSNLPPDYGGFHDVADCEKVYGWAWDKNQPDATLNVEIYDGNTLIATVPADIFREDLSSAGIGDGEHGFAYQLPPSLKDGRSHSIRVKIAGSNFDLKNTPKSLTCKPQ